MSVPNASEPTVLHVGGASPYDVVVGHRLRQRPQGAGVEEGYPLDVLSEHRREALGQVVPHHDVVGRRAAHVQDGGLGGVRNAHFISSRIWATTCAGVRPSVSTCTSATAS